MLPEHHPILGSGRGHHRGKVVSAEAAIQLIKTGDTVATGGFVGVGFAEAVASALEAQFIATSTPRDLTLVYAAGQGDGKQRGLNHLGHEGLLKRVIGGHWGLVPKIQKLAVDGKIEAYNLPQGVISHLFRDIAGHKPGHLSRIGLGTFVDPRHGGGKINDITHENLVSLMPIEGEEFLFYKAFPIDVAIIRGTTADPDGNVTMEREALTLEVLSIAMAARNSGGVVIVQVERIAERGTLHPRQVKIPGILVDCVVVAGAEQHWQTFAQHYNPAFSAEIKVPAAAIAAMEMNERKIIARRAAMELKVNGVVNLGIGMPEGVAAVAAEEKVLDLVTLTTEAGVIGGIPAGGLNFGGGVNPQAVIDQPYQFDFYDGGGLDIAILGLAQADRHGNLNVSRFGPRLAGAGGFINISQSAREVVFVGTFTCGDLQVEIADARLTVVAEGSAVKFVDQVQQRTFAGDVASKQGKRVLFVTERCVFRLNQAQLELIEIAPGIDLERDILARMAFKPLIIGRPALMDARIFAPRPMHLRDDMLAIPIAQRFSFDQSRNILFLNFEHLTVKTKEDVEAIRHQVESIVGPLGRRVNAVVNYDEFALAPEAENAYLEMVRDVVERFYLMVNRYTTSAFVRMKFGDELSRRGVAPHIYESADEAESHLA